MSTVEITITAIVAVLAGCGFMASIMMWRILKVVRKENERYISDCARLENELEEISAKFENEKAHTSWAIGRIKDLSSLNKGLERALKSASKGHYKAWKESNKEINEE